LVDLVVLQQWPLQAQAVEDFSQVVASQTALLVPVHLPLVVSANETRLVWVTATPRIFYISRP